MAGVVPIVQKFQFAGSTGAPLANGTVTVYLAGTTTLTNTWQDLALTTLNANPIVLDSRGECVIYLDPTLTYKFVLANAGGSIQWTADNVGGSLTAATLAASTGSSLVGFIQSGSGAVARTAQDKMRDAVSVYDFGVVADGSTNDATDINEALAAHQMVQLARGTMRCTASVAPRLGSIITGNPQEKLSYAGAQASVIKSSATKVIDGGTSGGGSLVLKGFELKPVTANVVGSYGLYAENLAYFEGDELAVRDFDTGIYFEKSQQYTLRQIRITGCNRALKFAADPGTYNVDWFNNNIILDNVIAAGSLIDANLDWQGQGLASRNCDFTGIATTGTRAAVRIRANSYDALFENPYFEPKSGDTAGGDVFLLEGGVTRISGGFAIGGGDATKRIGNYISAKNGAIVIVEGVTGFNFWTNLITADGAGTIVYVMPGTFTGNFDVSGPRFVETNGGRVIELGAMSDITFAAGNFTGGGSLTWTLTSPDQASFSYSLIGKQMTVTWYLQNTSTGGTANPTLQITVPGGKTVAKRSSATFSYVEAGTAGTGLCDALVGGTVIRLTKQADFGVNWSNASTDQLTVAGQLTFEVQ